MGTYYFNLFYSTWICETGTTKLLTLELVTLELVPLELVPLELPSNNWRHWYPIYHLFTWERSYRWNESLSWPLNFLQIILKGKTFTYWGGHLLLLGIIPLPMLTRGELKKNWRRTELRLNSRRTEGDWIFEGEFRMLRWCDGNWRELNFCGFAVAFMGNFRSIVVLVAIFQSIVGLPWIFLPSSGWPFLDLRTWLICLAFSHIEEEKGEEYIRIVFLHWFPRRFFFSKRLDF